MWFREPNSWNVFYNFSKLPSQSSSQKEKKSAFQDSICACLLCCQGSRPGLRVCLENWGTSLRKGLSEPDVCSGNGQCLSIHVCLGSENVDFQTLQHDTCKQTWRFPACFFTDCRTEENNCLALLLSHTIRCFADSNKKDKKRLMFKKLLIFTFITAADFAA